MDEINLLNIAKTINLLKSNKTVDRIKSIKLLPVVAKIIGPLRTKEEIVPLLKVLTFDDRNVCLIFGETIKNLLNEIALEDHFLFLESLFLLINFDDLKSRQKSIETTKEILNRCSAEIFQNHIIKFIMKLEQKRYAVSKFSLIDLLPLFNEKLRDFNCSFSALNIYKNLCNDKNPLVRKFASKNIISFYNSCDEKDKKIVLKIYFGLLIDVEERVQYEAIEYLYFFITKISDLDWIDFKNSDNNYIEIEEETEIKNEKIINKSRSTVQEILTQLTNHKSWSIRYAFANSFYKISTVFPQDKIELYFVPILQNLLEDNDKEVILAACCSLEKFIKLISVEVIEKDIVKYINSCFKMNVAFISKKIASMLYAIINIVETEETITELIDTVLEIDSDAQLEFLISIFKLKNHKKLKNRIDKIKNTLEILSKDPNWRIRKKIISIIPDLVQKFESFSFHASFSSITAFSLCDPINEVRIESCESISKMFIMFDWEWVKTHFYEFITSMTESKNFKDRVIVCKVIYLIIVNSTNTDSFDNLIYLLSKLLNDNTSNVQILALKCIDKILEKSSEENPKLKKIILSDIIAMVTKSTEVVDFVLEIKKNYS